MKVHIEEGEVTSGEEGEIKGLSTHCTLVVGAN